MLSVAEPLPLPRPLRVARVSISADTHACVCLCVRERVSESERDYLVKWSPGGWRALPLYQTRLQTSKLKSLLLSSSMLYEYYYIHTYIHTNVCTWGPEATSADQIAIDTVQQQKQL